MSTAAPLQRVAARPGTPGYLGHAGWLLQRKCACGVPTASLTGECVDCKSKKRLQNQLVIGASHDPLVRAADRVAAAHPALHRRGSGAGRCGSRQRRARAGRIGQAA